MTAETTQREVDSVRGTHRDKSWLSWVVAADLESIELAHGMVIGRDHECAVAIDGRGVSRRHLELYRQGPLFALRDLGSTNGTFLNGKRVDHAPIAPGDVLRIGDCVGVFRESAGRPRGFRSVSPGLLGGEELQGALASASRAATSNLPIVLIGPTGTGKERAARAIHALSGRTGPFHAINCAALPLQLAEAELFGHRKGAFTGAERPGLGHFRAADRGTLFLDEIAELPLSLQAKLLRVLEEHSVMPLGETESVPIDVRVVVAAQRPLHEFVQSRLFRDDLVARLAGLTVTLPELRERRADIAPLFSSFLRSYSAERPPIADAKLIEALSLLDWPGNVRDLEQLARQLLAVHGSQPTLTRAMLPDELQAQLPSSASPPVPAVTALLGRREHDRQRLTEALKKTGGGVAAAAALLGISRQRAYRLLAGHELDAAAHGASAVLTSNKDERA